MISRTRLGFSIAPALVVSAAVFFVGADAASPRAIRLKPDSTYDQRHAPATNLTVRTWDPASAGLSKVPTTNLTDRMWDPALAGLSEVPTPNLTVHEWGTFTSVAGPDGSAIDWDTLGCKDDLPRFVNDFGYRNFKWRLRGTVRMETPVLYFYSGRELEARVKVMFPQGAMTEWYPQADARLYQRKGVDGELRVLPSNLNGIDTSLYTITGAIEWEHITVQPDTTPEFPREREPSRYYAARDTDAAAIAVNGQHEKFLFYRGVGRFPIPLTTRVSPDGTVIVENRGRDAVPGVILFENRGGRIGYRAAGAVQKTITLDPLSLNDALPSLLHDLEETLVAQGLYEREAHAMIETWRDSWFEEGARLIYIVPSRAIDEFLPLRVEPAPSHTTRVFVGRIELVTPATTFAVEHALTMSDMSTLKQYGRFIEPILQRVGPASLESGKRAAAALQQCR